MPNITMDEIEIRIAKALAAAREELIQKIYPIKIYGLNGSQPYAEQVAAHLNVKVTPHDEKYFEDGESYVKSADGDIGNVRGHKVFVIQSLYSDGKESVSDKLVKLCIMCGSLKHASAHEITVVIPHLAWARQDRKTESRAPVTTKIVARMLESTGIARALFMDVHNLSAEQNAFDIPIDNLESKNLHAEWCADHLDPNRPIVTLSPDAGGYARTDRFRNALIKKLKQKWGKPPAVGMAIFDKLRQPNGTLTGGRIVGDVRGCQVIEVDDMISTGSTIAKASKTVVEAGGQLVAICATHGLFVGKANEFLEEIDAPIVVADTVAPFRLNANNQGKVSTVNTSKMFADAIWRIYTGTGSISELLR